MDKQSSICIIKKTGNQRNWTKRYISRFQTNNPRGIQKDEEFKEIIRIINEENEENKRKVKNFKMVDGLLIYSVKPGDIVTKPIHTYFIQVDTN